MAAKEVGTGVQCRYDDAGGLTPVTEEDAAMSPPVSAELLSVFLKIARVCFKTGGMPD